MSATSEWLIKLSLLSRIQAQERPKTEEKPRPNLTPAERKQTVVGKGHIPRDPINKQAAMLLAKANWLSQPPAIPLYEKKNTTQPKVAPTKRRKKKMKGTVSTNQLDMENRAPTPKTGKYVSEHGFTIQMINGQPFFNVDELNAWLASEVPKLIPSVDPAVQHAKDARTIIE